jgi:hypothetical protein
MTFGPIPGFRDDDDEAPPPRPGAFPGINGTAYAGRTAGPAAGSATEPWPVPLDLFAEHLAAGAAVDETCLPATILCFARAEAARLGVDPVGIAGLCVAVCSGAISDDWSVRLKRHDHWSQQPRLWVGLVDRPGSKKTEQIRAAKRPLDRMEAEARREFQLAAAAHKIAHEAWAKLPKKERDAQPEPEKPAEKRLTTQDSTIEAFSELLKSMPKIVALLDELAGFLASFDRYSSGGGKGSPGRSHAIELYEGGPRRIDRVMRGSVYVENWSAVVLGAIQPEKLRPMVADLSTDGLLQRFMFVMPSAVSAADPDDDDRPADKAALDAYERWCGGWRRCARPSATAAASSRRGPRRQCGRTGGRCSGWSSGSRPTRPCPRRCARRSPSGAACSPGWRWSSTASAWPRAAGRTTPPRSGPRRSDGRRLHPARRGPVDLPLLPGARPGRRPARPLGGRARPGARLERVKLAT